jgi:hypothetical protein
MAGGRASPGEPAAARRRFGQAIHRASEKVRERLERTTRRVPPVVTVAFVGALTAIVAALQLRAFTRNCGRLTISVMKLEVTFSSERFAAILGAAGDCGPNVVRSLVTWDLLFPVCYGLFLSAVFWWCERWRRVMPDGSLRPRRDLGIGRDIAILAPLGAGLLDIATENFPLWLAAKAIAHDASAVHALHVELLVALGSTGSSIKWVLLLFSTCFILVELLSGPRGHVAGRLRFSVLAVALGAIPLLAVPQGQDILQRLVEGEHPVWRIGTAIPALVFAALAVWYTGRKLLQFCFQRETDPSDDAWYAHFAEHLPRVLGVALLAIAGAAFARAGLAGSRFAAIAIVGYLVALLASRFAKGFTARIGRVLMLDHWKTLEQFDERIGRAMIAVVLGLLIWIPHWLPWENACWRGGCRLVESEQAIRYLRIAAWLCLLSAWGFYLHVYSRRGRLAARRETQEQRIERQQQLARETFNSREPNEVTAGLKIAVGIAALASLTVLGAFTFVPVLIGRFVGPLWVLALAAANAVFVGSITVWIRGRYGFRLVSLALVAAVLFSVWNDNHVVPIDPAGRDAVARRLTVSQHLDEWLRTRAVAETGDTVPVILVAAAGGGLRAAYWAAVTLAAVQDAAPSFSSHVFAASGVSGGSLGLALFTALSRDAQGAESTLPCAQDPATEAPASKTFGPRSACVRYFLRDDFLSPALAKMVAPDVAQWFVPFPITAFDRSKALEGSWNASYVATSGQKTFAEGIARFASDSAARNRIPALFLNSTHVETGRRYIASTLAGTGASNRDGTASGMLDSPDVLEILRADVPLSAAVHNSARFTYVSPAGRLDRNDGIEYGHVVDGGYFENSGLATLLEVFDAVRSAPNGGKVVRPIVLYLCNDPIPCAREMAGDPLITTEGALAGEWLAPARAVLQARGARGSLARAQIARMAAPGFFQLNVCDRLALPARVASRTDSAGLDSSRLTKARDRVIAPPLGWLLSRLARDWMDSSLVGKRAVDSLLSTGALVDSNGCRAHNAYVQARLASWLNGSTPPTPATAAARSPD